MARQGISSGLAAAVDAMGSAGFHRALLDALSPLLPWTFRYLYIYRRNGPPLVPFFEGLDAAWIERYLDGYYRFDPFYRMCLHDSPHGVHLLADHVGSSAGGRRYGSFLAGAAIFDDVVLMLPMDGATMALSWDRSFEPFPATAIADLSEAAPLALALNRAHGARHAEAGDGTAWPPEGAPSPLAFEEAVAAFLPETLTPREGEIVGLALNGFDNGAIARRLGISDQVVRNRRRGIYDKLDITSERELFRLFLDHVMGDVAVPRDVG